MELDDFKSIGLSMEDGKPKGNGEQTESLLRDLKAMDAKMKKMTAMLIAMNSALFATYAGIFTMQDGWLRTGYSLLILGFVLIIAWFGYKFIRLKKINYAAPVNKFLEQAIARYTFMRTIDWIVTIPLLAILGTGGLLVVWFRFKHYFDTPYIAALIYLLVFSGAIVVGFWSSLKEWKKTYGPLVTRIKMMQAELHAG